jgi:hypothetical protein
MWLEAAIVFCVCVFLPYHKDTEILSVTVVGNSNVIIGKAHWEYGFYFLLSFFSFMVEFIYYAIFFSLASSTFVNKKTNIINKQRRKLG